MFPRGNNLETGGGSKDLDHGHPLSSSDSGQIEGIASFRVVCGKPRR